MRAAVSFFGSDQCTDDGFCGKPQVAGRSLQLCYEMIWDESSTDVHMHLNTKIGIPFSTTHVLPPALLT